MAGNDHARGAGSEEGGGFRPSVDGDVRPGGMVFAPARGTMRGQALILGSQTYGLTGVLSDARRVADALGGLGFRVSTCLGEQATREGILQHCHRLIERCAPDEAAFVYYAGHGAWSPEPGVGVQFIVPVDFERSTDEDFRGIVSLELAVLLQALTARTSNVTVVLDCCFAARMCRGGVMTPRSLPAVPPRMVRAHLMRLLERDEPPTDGDLEGNPRAVRLVAAALDEQAYEYTNARGERTGLLTEAFLESLDEARGLRVSWNQLGRRIRERVLARCPLQRPELEGPGQRLLFQLEEAGQDTSLAYYPERGHHWLRGGRPHGVHVGDEYAVMPLGAGAPDEGRALGLARVVEVLGGVSRVRFTAPFVAPPPTGAPAFLLRSVQPRRPVALTGAWDGALGLGVLLREALQASPVMRPAADPEPEPVLAQVRLGERGVDILDGGLDRIVHPLRPAPPSLPRLLQTLEVLARAQQLREFASTDSPASFEAWLELEWGRVRERRTLQLPTVGASLHLEDRIYVRLRNRGRLRLFVSVLTVGVGGTIHLLNVSQPSGLVLGGERVETLGVRPDGELVGLALDWPEATPREDARPESLVLIASEAPVDLRSLETGGPWASRGPVPRVEQLLHRMAGVSRPALPSSSPGMAAARYAVKHIGFWLDPQPRR